MSAQSRRVFLAQTAALVSAARASFAKPLQAKSLGVELYTVRDIITKNPSAVLNAIQEIGYTGIEATYATVPQIWPAVQQTSLKPVSVHIDYAIYEEGGERLNAALQDVKQRGFQYVVVPYVPPEKRGGPEASSKMDMFKRLAATINKSAKLANESALSLCYHNHAFEYEPLNGTNGLEILMSETDSALVSLELDIFWASVGGHDPLEILQKYSGRVRLLHLKDKASGLATQYNETVPHSAFKEVGNGTLNIPAILSAADSAGVQHYFVEQDQTPPAGPIASLRQSFKYLSTQFKS